MSLFKKVMSTFSGKNPVEAKKANPVPKISSEGKPMTKDVSFEFEKTMLNPESAYASMTDAKKVEVLEKAVQQQGDYLKAYRDSIKNLNRRNTLAVIELQKLVRDAEMMHPDLVPMIDPVMKKVGQILDFKQPYDVTG